MYVYKENNECPISLIRSVAVARLRATNELIRIELRPIDNFRKQMMNHLESDMKKKTSLMNP